MAGAADLLLPCAGLAGCHLSRRRGLPSVGAVLAIGVDAHERRCLIGHLSDRALTGVQLIVGVALQQHDGECQCLPEHVSRKLQGYALSLIVNCLRLLQPLFKYNQVPSLTALRLVGRKYVCKLVPC